MKPVRLEFGGLQSYRQAQAIDFETLGSSGVFGVFGPTGSGKSTILDAMTLALFGHVNRADRGTRGIINQQESSAQVSFEFELGGKRYRVERRYDREPAPRDPSTQVEGTRAKYARLRLIGPGGTETVLASTPAETDRAVQDLLGLSREEFFRAVVLPQGKFDEFLKLTGGQRAAMLEHIFDLGRFGDDLAKKAAGLRDRMRSMADEIQAEQRGLGECTDEAISRAEAQVEEQRGLLQQIKRALSESEARFKALSRLKELHTQREAAAARMLKLEANASEMRQAEEAIERAEKAEAVRRLIEQEGTLDRAVADLRASLEKDSGLLDEAERAFNAALRQAENAEKKRDRELPGLMKRKAELEQAAAKGQKAASLVMELESARKSLDGQRLEMDDLTRKRGEIDEKIRLLSEKYEGLQERRSQSTTDPAERDRVEAAFEVLQRLEPEEAGLNEAQEEMQGRVTESRRLWGQVLRLLREAYPGCDLPEGAGIDALVDGRVASIEVTLKDAEESLRAAEAHMRAALVARDLREGEPCPVCGSREHPDPAEPGPELEPLQGSIAQLKGQIVEARRWRDRVLAAHAGWVAAAAEVLRTREACDARKRRVESLQAAFQRAKGGLDRESLRKRRAEIQGADRLLSSLDKAVREVENDRSSLERESAKIEARLRAVSIEVASGDTKVRELANQVQQVREEIDLVTRGVDLTVLVGENEKAITILRGAAETSRAEAEKAREVRDTLLRNLTSLRSRLETSEGTLRDVRASLHSALLEAGFQSQAEAKAAMLPAGKRESLKNILAEYRRERTEVEAEIARLQREMGGQVYDDGEYSSAEAEVRDLGDRMNQATEGEAVARERLNALRQKRGRWLELEAELLEVSRKRDLAETLARLLQGRKLVQFMAEEHLRDMVGEASQRLGRLSGQRYALELAEGCTFVIRDDYNGGLRRAVSTLSGGETFLTSLALALALSSKIQLRGQYPLGFFFLDEGFGTLDDEKLELVMSALEKIHDRERMVGVISHVKELKDRLPHYIEVQPPREDGTGSVIRVSGN